MKSKLLRLFVGLLCLFGIQMTALPQAIADTGIPSAPVIAAQGSSLDRDQIQVRFNRPSGNGAEITSYDIWVSDDATGNIWTSKYSAVDSRDVAIIGIPVPAGSARLVKVRAKVGSTPGDWSATREMFTKGSRAMRVYVQAPDGTPVTGGVITWAMANGSARSSKTYGLTSLGYIDFPAAPAGEVEVTLTNGELPNGVLVSGTFAAILGYASTILRIPVVPEAVHIIKVAIPNGLPVSNASIQIYSDDMADTKEMQGFSFHIPNSGLLSVSSDNSETDWFDDGDYWDYEEYDYWTNPNVNLLRNSNLRSVQSTDSGSKVTSFRNNDVLVAEGTTNTMGRFAVFGFTQGVPDATVSYDDGVILQTQDVQLQGSMTEVELDYIPYVSVSNTAVSVQDDTVVTVPVSVIDPLESIGGLRASVIRAARFAGVAVQVKAPKGAPKPAKGKCKSAANTVAIGSAGRANVKVCATKSGNYRVLSKSGGILSMGSVQIFVKGAAPMSVQKVKGRSTAVGSVTLSWSKPRYSGGKKILYYLVQGKSGKSTVTAKVKKLNYRFVNLANGKRYTFSIRAVTKFGKSDPIKVLVPVS